MKNYQVFVISVVGFSCVSAFSIPDPRGLRIREIVAIAENADLAKTIEKSSREGRGSGYIDGILYAESTHGLGGRYAVRSGSCQIAVDVSYAPLAHPGLGKMSLSVNDNVSCE